MAPDLSHIDAIDGILRDWLGERGLTILCGRWGDGGVMELIPQTRARLTPPRYGGAFAGLRDLVIDGELHHMHLDLARLSSATYVVSPSVCFGFRPSFEVRFSGPDDVATQSFAMGLAVRQPYRGGVLCREAVGRYFRRFTDHRRRFPTVVSLIVVDSALSASVDEPFDWRQLAELAGAAAGGSLACASAADFSRALSQAGLAANQPLEARA